RPSRPPAGADPGGTWRGGPPQPGGRRGHLVILKPRRPHSAEEPLSLCRQHTAGGKTRRAPWGKWAGGWWRRAERTRVGGRRAGDRDVAAVSGPSGGHV